MYLLRICQGLRTVTHYASMDVLFGYYFVNVLNLILVSLPMLKFHTLLIYHEHQTNMICPHGMYYLHQFCHDK